MLRAMDRADVAAYMARDFESSAESKAAHWARAYRARGPIATLEVSDALRAHMRSVRPDWPTPEDREADFSHHVAERRLLERIAHALAHP